MSDFIKSISNTNFSFLNFLGAGAAIGISLWALVHRKFIYIVIRTFPRDMRALSRFFRVMLDLRYFQRHNYTVARAFDDIVQKHPKKVLLRFEDQSWTAEQIQKFSYKVANYFQQQGYKKGDKVAIFMENSIEYVGIWLGLSRIGCISSLVNYNLRLQPLKHCFDSVNCKSIIYSPGLSHAIEELVDLGDLVNVSIYCAGHDPSKQLSSFAKDLLGILKDISESAPIVTEPLGFLDPLIYIYTSGTTGLPKAATIKMSRYFMAAVGNFYVHGINKNDTLYTALPLYHGGGSMLGSGTMLVYGLTQVLRSKFSASKFWSDCIRYNVTAAQYIGEICRYLIAQPPSPIDKSHTVRVMFGNGLKAEIWGDFVKRFNIKHISELYGATEGNCNMVNMDDRIGAVGFIPILFKRLLPLKVVKVDEVTGEPLRNSKGFAIPCEANEPGELIGKIRRNHPISDFEGYADQNSSKDKVLFNAFRNGDRWFRSGDILMMDDYGYFYFCDRKGDTFRWKGENCSTLQIEAVIITASKLQDAVVFGVTIPGTDGRAGMAVISDPDNNLDLNHLASEMFKNLPSYARPLFIRITPTLEKTGTYKLTKVNYQKVGFDINQTSDKIYFLNRSKYVPLTQELYDDIMTGILRV